MIEALEIGLEDSDHPAPSSATCKLLTTVSEFGGYLRGSVTIMPNYGERYRAGEIIASASSGRP